MIQDFFNSFIAANYSGTHPSPALIAILVCLSIWSLAWKGVALWKAAHNNSKPWFVVLLIVNTAGILEILYIFLFSKKKPFDSAQGKNSQVPPVQ